MHMSASSFCFPYTFHMSLFFLLSVMTLGCFLGWDEDFDWTAKRPPPLPPTCISIYLYLEDNLEDRYPELYTRGFVWLFTSCSVRKV
ncbi:hypothetical protein BO82DRAFT_167879 [Aspergillus uvarum CBS 121591]|uniref:Uncharacterized protein n=1 Tax=Aspergillus uvarum CBS 121591 TaxID=1448315 RepID=A0A319C195_9EURO|nr:hypothetical protein BO82DRAFT_167879 [Aspergillus uvarum CBS 121591]PYH78091.1 hypothetical protein BO82DRAFT_167879 [Aspergillus uvarum CBS 121591]